MSIESISIYLLSSKKIIIFYENQAHYMKSTKDFTFLVFCDWYNPGNVFVWKTNGTAIQGVLLKETLDEIVVQVDQPTGGCVVGDKITLAKTDIAAIEQAETWVITIYHIRFYLAAAMGLLVLLMVWRWFDGGEVKEWLQNTWYFAKLLVPLLFGGVFIVGFVGDAIECIIQQP